MESEAEVEWEWRAETQSSEGEGQVQRSVRGVAARVLRCITINGFINGIDLIGLSG